MSQQEFFRPEQDYDATRQGDFDYQEYHRELTGEHPAWEQHDETSRGHLVGEKLHPRQRSRPSPLHILITVLVLIIFVSVFSIAIRIEKFISLWQSPPVQVYYSHKHDAPVVNIPSQQFPVTGPVKLVINDAAGGLIRIHTGDTSQVVVSETPQSEHRDSLPDLLPLKPVQIGNTLDITVIGNLEDDDSAGVILDVYTPRSTSVDVNAPLASINVEGVDGQVIASTNDGSITATDDNMSGPSSLQSQDGDIRFTGSLDAKGTYQFLSDSGDIDISVPENSSFHLITTDINPDNITNEFGSNIIGDHPVASVTVHTEEGSVALHKY